MSLLPVAAGSQRHVPQFEGRPTKGPHNITSHTTTSHCTLPTREPGSQQAGLLDQAQLKTWLPPSASNDESTPGDFQAFTACKACCHCTCASHAQNPSDNVTVSQTCLKDMNPLVFSTSWTDSSLATCTSGTPMISN